MKHVSVAYISAAALFAATPAIGQTPAGPNFRGILTVQTNFAGGGPTVVVENANPDGDVAIDLYSAGEFVGNVAVVREPGNEPSRFGVLQSNDAELPLTLSEQGLGFVGIGIPDPVGALHVRSHLEGGGPTLVIDNMHEAGTSDVAIDFQAGGEYFGNIALTDLGAYGARMIIMQNNPNFLNLTLLEDADGNVGIGTSNPYYRLDVNGTIRATSFILPSDARLKHHIEEIPNALDTVMTLRGVRFAWLSEELADPNAASRNHLGVIAQEVEQTIPELVTTDATGYKAVAYTELTALLIEALKGLRAENIRLAERVAVLEASKSN